MPNVLEHALAGKAVMATPSLQHHYRQFASWKLPYDTSTYEAQSATASTPMPNQIFSHRDRPVELDLSYSRHLLNRRTHVRSMCKFHGTSCYGKNNCNHLRCRLRRSSLLYSIRPIGSSHLVSSCVCLHSVREVEPRMLRMTLEAETAPTARVAVNRGHGNTGPSVGAEKIVVKTRKEYSRRCV